LAELMGAGDKVDDETFIEQGVDEDFLPILVKRAEALIEQAGEEFKNVYMAEYRRVMTARLGLKTQKDSDFQEIISELLHTQEALELDYNHFFRRLSSVKLAELKTKEQREGKASIFFHHEGITSFSETEEWGREKVGKWLGAWRQRVLEDWGDGQDAEREKAMKAVNPNFVPRGWILEEVIRRIQDKKDREILGGIMKMALNPFQDDWGWNKAEEERFCGDVPRSLRGIQCSCSS
jgi:uncharacterized protein YdiU (UPF0061 family)